MIEEILAGRLSASLGVPVVLELPSPLPEKPFVLLDKTGSTTATGYGTATFAVQSWADTLYHAAALNERAKAALQTLDEMDDIAAVDIQTDYNFTDPATKRYRYQIVAAVTFYIER